MYNHQLDSFIKVAELKGFSKASEALFITPSAVMQQINILEKDLNVTLFRRSRRGVVLTDAGQYLYDEGKSLIHYSNALRQRLAELSNASKQVIHAAVDFFHQPQRLYEIWPEFLKESPDYTLDTTFFISGESTLLSGIDLVEGVYYRENWQQNFYFIHSHTVPLYVGIPRTLFPENKQIVTIDDLRSTPVLTIPKGVSDAVDEASLYLEENGIKTVTVYQIDASAVALCISHKYAMLCPACWQNLHPSMRLLPMDWTFQLPYGFFEAKQPSPAAAEFYTFLSQH